MCKYADPVPTAGDICSQCGTEFEKHHEVIVVPDSETPLYLKLHRLCASVLRVGPYAPVISGAAVREGH